ncbi:QcrA and Rieske domain-containing protein [Pyxidicoccus xibeiensis]|uniref:QcrA and Rieske domain-containing protein n=1 Tax=Pyxidicoccus xibeiensis TaxID=2906759 RepID=UPI0020A6E787|nr:Rieske 2Fe-2S domain-containing protein [Pyxidicoccus xibeiensis]MCP3139343.1 Rieske 2Fe-2S domain-containing protein [Pyxidicoccus xibeiensis]
MSRPPPSPHIKDVDRRTALRTLLQGTCALAAVGAGCGGEWREAIVLDAPDAGGAPGAACDGTPGTPEEGWVEVRLADHPALREPGGHAEVRVPQALLDVVVVHTRPGCYAALWRICTHGDCAVGWRPAEGVVECPCHGSRFAEDGRVLNGPATRPLATFKAVRAGDSLFLHRPR